MKKFTAFLSTLICAVFLISCNFTENCGYVTGINDSIKTEKATLTIKLAKMNTSAVLGNIYPVDWTDARKTQLNYVLTGSKTEGGANIITSGNTFSYTDLSTGNATIDLEPAVWYLTLTAYQDDEIALVSNERETDLTGGHNSATFNLSAVTSTNATGDVEITVKFPKSENFATVTYGLYTSSVLNNTNLVSGTNAITDYDQDITLVNEANQIYSITYSATDIKAGNGYYFNASFKDDTEKQIAYYTEKVIIDGGNLSSKTITLGDIFNKPPRAVSNFQVSYSYNNNGMNPVELADGEAVPSTYTATFTWTDNSDNETEFELKVPSSTGIQVLHIPASTESFVCPISFETGTTITAQIRAVNDFSPAFGNDTTVQSLDNINLYTVTYVLNNGKIKLDTSTTTAETTVKYVIPYNKSSTALPLLTDANTDTPYVFRTSYNFVNWTTGAEETPITSIPANNYENYTVNAVWTSTLNISAYFPSYSELNEPLSTYADNELYTISGTPAGTDRTVVVSLNKSAEENITEVKYAIYDSFNTLITSTPDDDTTGNFIWTITDMDAEPAETQLESETYFMVPAGTYRVEITGKVDGIDTTGSLYIKITR